MERSEIRDAAPDCALTRSIRATRLKMSPHPAVSSPASDASRTMAKGECAELWPSFETLRPFGPKLLRTRAVCVARLRRPRAWTSMGSSRNGRSC